MTVTRPGSGARGQLLDELGRHVRVAQLLDRALGGAGPGDDEHRGAAGGDVRAQVGQRPVGVAAVRLDLVHGRRQDVVPARRSAG